VAASAIHATAMASSTVQGETCSPATTRVNVSSSVRNAPVNRSMKNVHGVPAGQAVSGSRLPSGVRSDQPAQTLSSVPCTSSRTSWPRALYRVLVMTAVAPSAKVSSVVAVATSPSSAKNSAPWAVPLA
jgi:hypothetical protein